MNARDLARRVLERIERDGAWATLALDGELSRFALADAEARLATELVYGVLRHRTRIDHVLAGFADPKRTPERVLNTLRLATYQLLWLQRVPAYAAVDDAVTSARQIGGNKLGGFVNAVLRRLGRDGAPSLPPPGKARIAIEHSLPAWIVDELAAALGADASDELDDAALALAAQAPLVLRGNPRGGDRDTLVATLTAEGATAEALPGAPMAMSAKGLGDLRTSPSFRAGAWTVQDLGAQRVGLAAVAGGLPDGPLRVLDACAGVGGKSTHLAELLGERAQIIAADMSATKLGLLGETARRLGLTTITPMQVDLTAAGTGLPDACELVVLDAPCSGLGVLRRHPDAKWRLRAEDLPPLVALQRRLLEAVAPRVAAGGALLYSVCSFANAEGPAQIAGFVAGHPEFSVELEERTWPHRDGADGFYLARLRRAASLTP